MLITSSMLELCNDKDLKRFLSRLHFYEYIEKNSPCSAKQVKKAFNISETELYRRLDKMAKCNYIVKDDENEIRKYYSHFTIIKQPLLKTELLNLYNNLIERFSKKFKEIAGIQEIIEIRNENTRVKSLY